MYSNKPILLVEDDYIDQRAVQKAFEHLDIKNKLIIKEDGEKGLEYLNNKVIPCLILLDLNMPRMSGIEFLKEIKQNQTLRKIPIVVFTTSNEENEKLKAYDIGIAGYIIKPLEYKKFQGIFKTVDEYWTISQGPNVS